MAHFNAAVVTKAGMDLALGAAAGVQSIEFVKMVSGNGEYTEEEKSRDVLRERSGLKSQIQEFPFNSVEIISEKTAVLKSIITNKSLTDGYRITEIGVYARAKGTEGEGILYSIALSIEADYLPPFVNPTEIIQEYYITVSDTAEISIVPNSGAYALAEDLEKLKTDIENTGILGGGSEGGEEDDNTIIGTMKKDIADLKNPVFDFVEERENVESEDTHKTLWGKVKKWFSDLKDAAFCSVVNHCLATKPGTVLDGRVGTDLQEQINGLKQEDERINSNISFPDGSGFYLDTQDGVRGYNTDAARGADTFYPFSGGQFPDLTQGYILPLINNTFDVKTIAPKKYKEYTSANFRAVISSLGSYNQTNNSDGGNVNTYSINQNPSCSYNPNTGIVTVNPGRNGNHIKITYIGETRLNKDFYASNTAMLLFTP